MIQIDAVLDRYEVAAIAEAIDSNELFVDGTKTAGWHARAVKHNLQAGDHPVVKGVLTKVRQALAGNAVFQAAALPKEIKGVLLSRYEPGMAYGAHVDDALMAGTRTDMSFTLFLSDPQSYDGGALAFHNASGPQTQVKLPAGSLILYPTSSVHEVTEVTKGYRLAAVGWVRSFVRRADQREVLTDLALTSRAEFDAKGKTPLFDTLAKTRSNLLRMWAED